MACGGPPGPFIAVAVSNLTTTFTPGCRDTGTTVGGMKVYEMPNSPYEAMAVAPMTGAEWLVCPCNTVSDFPRPCPHHPSTDRVSWPYIPPPASPLSDEDVRRIAREVVRQFAQASHDPGDEDTGDEDERMRDERRRAVHEAETLALMYEVG